MKYKVFINISSLIPRNQVFRSERGCAQYNKILSKRPLQEYHRNFHSTQTFQTQLHKSVCTPPSSYSNTYLHPVNHTFSKQMKLTDQSIYDTLNTWLLIVCIWPITATPGFKQAAGYCRHSTIRGTETHCQCYPACRGRSCSPGSSCWG